MLPKLRVGEPSTPIFLDPLRTVFVSRYHVAELPQISHCNTRLAAQTDRAAVFAPQKKFGQGRWRGRPLIFFLLSSLIKNLLALSHIVCAHVGSLKNFGRWGPAPCDGGVTKPLETLSSPCRVLSV